MYNTRECAATFGIQFLFCNKYAKKNSVYDSNAMTRLMGDVEDAAQRAACV